MAFAGDVDRKCESLNKKGRNVRENSRSLHVSSFWQEAPISHFAICGGSDEVRSAILLQAVIGFRNRFSGPIIILNGSSMFERLMRAYVEKKCFGNLVVSSDSYRNYDPLLHLSRKRISSFFERMERVRGGQNVTELAVYADAFLSVLSTRGDLGLDSIIAFSELTDERICEIGKYERVDIQYLNTISSLPQVGVRFRGLVQDLKDAFSSIYGGESYGYNLAGIEDNNMHLVWAHSVFQDDFNSEIALEIETLINHSTPFMLVINEVPVGDGDLARVISNAKKASGVCVGLCTCDLATWDENLVRNTPNMFVLCTGHVDTQGLNTVLQRLGTYQHYEPVIGVHLSSGWNPLGTGDKSISMNHYERQRVLAEDVEGKFSVVAKGRLGSTIELYKGLMCP